MNRQRYRWITGVLLIGWMMVIFWFSAQPAEESGKMSGGVAYYIMEAYDRVFDADMPEGELALKVEILDYPLRKMAHMTEYALLAMFAALSLLGYRKWGRNTICSSLFFAAGYAVTDEIHQLFVPGRAGRMSDVCIDTLGAAIGLFFLAIVLKIGRRHCEKLQHLLK